MRTLLAFLLSLFLFSERGFAEFENYELKWYPSQDANASTNQTPVPNEKNNAAELQSLLLANSSLELAAKFSRLPDAPYGWQLYIPEASAVIEIKFNNQKIFPIDKTNEWKYLSNKRVSIPNNLLQDNNVIVIQIAGSKSPFYFTDPYYTFSTNAKLVANDYHHSKDIPSAEMISGVALFLTIIFLAIYLKSSGQRYWLLGSGSFLIFFLYMLLQTSYASILLNSSFSFVKLQWVSFAFFSTLTHLFILSFFKISSSNIEKTILASWLPWSISALAQPSEYFYYHLPFAILLGLCMVFFLGSRLKNEVTKGRFGAKRMTFGYIMLVISMSHDIVMPSALIKLHPYGILLFASSILMILLDVYFSQTTRLNELNKTLHQQKLAFARFVPVHFLDMLKKEDITELSLGDQKEREMTVLFVDIRDFTRLSENMSPEDNFNFLNSYLKRMVPVVQKHNGVIDKYIGDAIMALFPHRPEDAVNAALEMLQVLKEYNLHRKSMDYDPIEIGIGIHTGSIMLGTIGQEDRMDTTVISDTVNLCQRIESLTKQYKTPILISESMLMEMDDPSLYPMRIIDNVQVKGKSRKVSIFEVFSDDDPNRLESRAIFEHGVYLYLKGNYESARLKFLEVLKLDPLDTAASIYLKRANENLAFSWGANNANKAGAIRIHPSSSITISY